MNRATPAFLLFLMALAGLAVASPLEPSWFGQRPAEGVGTVVVPDEFLRSWDPVTIFFPRDQVPEAGPEDHPEAHATLQPPQPGAWHWLDRRTLQFRPAEPWAPLSRVRVATDRHSAVLSTLLPAPIETLPRDGARGLSPVSSITLTFREPVDTDILAQTLRIELRDLPGVGSEAARWLDGRDLDIQALEGDPSDGARYELRLAEPIPAATQAIVHLQLGLEDKDDRAFTRIRFSTSEPFRPARLGCGRNRLPVTPEGTHYTEAQALECSSGARAVVLQLNARPGALGPVEARNLVRLEPAVDDVSYQVQGRNLVVQGAFEPETLYRVSLAPSPLEDVDGRSLDISGTSSVYLHFPQQDPYLRFTASQGLVERLGPQTVPMQGRGDGQVDLRIHPIDPLERSFWPFPSRPVVVDESQRPPGPGEEPDPHTDPRRPITSSQLAQQVRTLGSPALSTLVDLPLGPDRGAASFGLDLAPHLAHVGGSERPGTYLVGVRRLEAGTQRAWMRLQVTDLSLVTVEEPEAVQFVVTSLSSAAPVARARVRVEGAHTKDGETTFETLAEGRTDRNGIYTWEAPGSIERERFQVGRLVVEHGDDVLVLNPSRPPERYADNHWGSHPGGWLQWAFRDLDGRGPQAEILAHIFTERPVYRPEHEVHIRGWIRERDEGTLTPLTEDGHVIVQGPGDLIWRQPVEVSRTGGFYLAFSDDDLPTGTYRAHFEDAGGQAIGHVSFQVEAYQIPRFEVRLHGPRTVPLDRPFDVGLTASFYAGGRVAERPVRWRVTQYPKTWAPEAREGYRYSSDGRYGGGQRFDASPRFEKTTETDVQGRAEIELDPAVEPTAQPRTYVVEATVTGDDDQTVTSSRRVVALPPFVLGLNLPRYIEEGQAIEGAWLAADHEGELLEGQPVTLRLLHRQWHAHLQASDFSDGEARYVTEVVDEPISEVQLTSEAEPSELSLPVPEAGVYVVELEAHDRLGRAQVVSVDLYVAGDEAMTWDQPQAGVFSVSTDQDTYAPGETARLVLESPYQNARALVIVEAPDENVYAWTRVRGGSATVRVPITAQQAPRLPVHVVLMRGRVTGTGPGATGTDPGKPETVANSTYLQVEPVGNQVDVELSHPEQATPGEEVQVTVQARTPDGRPAQGEATLWLVDAAVLSLGREQRLDPLPDFITPVTSHLSLSDTRNLVFGDIPYDPMPGGDGEAEAEAPDILEHMTPRKDFRPVPFYEAALPLGPDGRATATIDLPDNLTVFRVRAKVASGPERFGKATGDIAVRLPVIVEPHLPRFVRPGDRFEVSGLARVIEGDGGAASAELQVEGLDIADALQRDFELDTAHTRRLGFSAEALATGYTDDGVLERDEVTVTLGVRRESDGVGDAFQVSLPIQPDRPMVAERVLAELTPGEPFELEALAEPARPGTVRRSLLISDRPEMVRMAGALDFFEHFPDHGTEQRLSRARSYLALGTLRQSLAMRDGEARTERAVRDTLQWLPQVIDADGLVANWPGANGRVTLTADALRFLVEAQEAAYRVDPALEDRLVDTLQKGLRSDFGRFVDGESFYERTVALEALASTGRFDQAYFAELAREAQTATSEGMARIALAGSRAGEAEAATVKRLVDDAGRNVEVQLVHGQETYAGLRDRHTRNPLIWPSETRAVATLAQAMNRAAPDHPRLPVLHDALVTMGRGDGWGQTNANAAALMALSEALRTPSTEEAWSVRLTLDGTPRVLHAHEEPVLHHLSSAEGGGSVELITDHPETASLRLENRYLPQEDGSQVAAAANGFVVERKLMHIEGDGPARRRTLDEPGQEVSLEVGDVIEEHVQVVVPETRHHVAVIVPLAAGVEALNPALATAPPEATPQTPLTRAPTYVAKLDDHVAFFYDTLPRGTYDFAFRSRASIAGTYIQPPATAEALYDRTVRGRSAGARVRVRPEEEG